MEIKFNPNEKTIEIKDGLKSYYFLLKTMMIINLINAVLNLLDSNATGANYITLIWVILGVISVAVLYFLISKKTALEKIPIEAIFQLKEKTSFGKQQLCIALKNGKERPLNNVKTQSEFSKTKKLFTKIGITYISMPSQNSLK